MSGATRGWIVSRGHETWTAVVGVVLAADDER